MNETGRRRDGDDAGTGTSASEKAAELKQPRKRHGDALSTGTGTRHGVQHREERPKTGAEEGERND
jgi:hypothetical protein